MCGIFLLLNATSGGGNINNNKSLISDAFKAGQGRGPEQSSLTTPYPETVFGFHRLAINGLNAAANQPLEVDNVVLICNGEIYNYKELYDMMNSYDDDDAARVEPKTESDCEVILHLYIRFGIEYTLQLLDGVFAFALLDRRTMCARLYVARDPFGVRPLYWLHSSGRASWALASELKQLIGFHAQNLVDRKNSDLAENGSGLASARVAENGSGLASARVAETQADRNRVAEHFPPGSYASWTYPEHALATWSIDCPDPIKYHTLGFAHPTGLLVENRFTDLSDIHTEISQRFRDAVFKRCCTTERPIACLLSGGLDSSLVAALVSEYHTTHGLPPVETYSIGLAGSTDLAYARKVAEHLGTQHHEVVVLEQDFIDAVPHVIRAIESYDTTTVRASLGNWLIGKYIRANSEAKVIFNGDGSDELAGGYLYMALAPNALEFDCECRRLLGDIYAYDVLRSDKCISSHGLEPRTPFLDRGWVQYYLSIPPTVRFNPDAMEKQLLRHAFSGSCSGSELLPSDVLWRRKEAFSDGVTGINRSLFQILQDHAATLELPLMLNDNDGGRSNPRVKASTAEQRWYRHLFDTYYPGADNVVPYFWMPKYVEAVDASARTWIV